MTTLEELLRTRVARFVDRQHRSIGAGASGKSDPRAIAAEPFTLSVMFVPPGQGNAAHTHEVEEVFFILDGYADPALQAKRDVHLGAARG